MVFDFDFDFNILTAFRLHKSMVRAGAKRRVPFIYIFQTSFI